MKCILTRLTRTIRPIDQRKLNYFVQPTRSVKVLAAFERIKLTRAMSTCDQTKRAIESDECSAEKRVKAVSDLASDAIDAVVGDMANELDLNDYRNFRIKEDQVGIVEFVSENKGFKCELKQRFSDFIVHEIAADGQITKVTSVEVPDMAVEVIRDEEIINLIPEETREKLARLDEQKELTDESVLIDVHEKDKNERTRVHKFVNRYLSLESQTKEVDGRKCIKVVKLKPGTSRRAKDSWPAGLPIYLHFNLYQENKGTTDALADLAKKLRISVKNIGYAGLKDKRAISTQQCSLFKITPQKLLDFNARASTYKFPSFAGNFRFRDVPIFLGDAIGNRFEIVLRDVVCENMADIDAAIENVKTNGYINYFGIQRFGHSEYPSHRVGIAIIQKQFKEAIDLILRYRQKDLEPAPFAKQKKTFNECLRIYREQNDATRAYHEFFWKSSNEGLLLKGLSFHGTNYFQAFTAIPRNSRSFYCHSFQSFIWNQIASYRFRTYGLKLVKGDLVIRRKDLSDENGKETSEPDDKVEKSKATKNERQKLNYIREFENNDVIVVDESNLEDYTIFDVVLPMIGPEVRNPENTVKDEIARLLTECRVTDEQLRSIGDIFFTRGSYRRFLAKPIDLKHEIVRYNSNTVRLFESDLDKFLKINQNVEKEGSKMAVKLEFSLPSCTYATVLIRELSRQNV